MKFERLMLEIIQADKYRCDSVGVVYNMIELVDTRK